jgi:hypothetical protein
MDDRLQMALLKRDAERRLVARGWSRREACAEVGKMTPDQLRRTARVTLTDRLMGLG